MALTTTLKWNGHQSTLASASVEFQKRAQFCDVTIKCAGGTFRCHSSLLSAASDFFKNIFREYPPHLDPLIVVQDVEQSYIKAILSYIYTGIVAIDATKAPQFLETCAALQIKGLMDHQIFARREDLDDLMVIESEFSEPVGEEPEHQASDVNHSQGQTMAMYLVSHGDSLIQEPIYEESTIAQAAIDQQTIDNAEAAEMEEGVAEEFDEELEEEEDEEVCETEDKEGEATSEDEPVFKSHRDQEKEEQSDQELQVEHRARKRKVRAQKSPAKAKPRSHGATYRYTEEVMEKGIRDVCSGKLSLHASSVQYDIPKSVLWRRLQKRSDYSPRQLDKKRKDAKIALLSGETLTSVSKRFNVPISTLYRDKTQLHQDGSLPKSGNREYTKQAIALAMEDIQKGMSQSAASRKYSLAKSTLWRKIKASSR